MKYIILIIVLVFPLMVKNAHFENEDVDDADSNYDVGLKNIYYLLTRKNPTNGQILIDRDLASIKKSNFIKGFPTKFLIHGWNGGIKSDINKNLTEAFLSHGDYNVICLDWSASGEGSGSYITWVKNLPKAALAAANFLNWLAEVKWLSPKDIHIAGFSLGGHLAGNVGRNIKSGKIEYITGLDPAGPGFKHIVSKLSLIKTDANYVEVIHTNTAFLGKSNQMGHADFYPNGALARKIRPHALTFLKFACFRVRCKNSNPLPLPQKTCRTLQEQLEGGENMPGCSLEKNTFGGSSCSHARSYVYLADSINDDRFEAIRCKSIKEVVKGNCSNTGSLKMGGIKSKPLGNGIYYLKTAKNKPFALPSPKFK